MTAAKKRGPPVAIVNRDVTRRDRHVNLKIDVGRHEPLGAVTTAVIADPVRG